MAKKVKRSTTEDESSAGNSASSSEDISREETARRKRRLSQARRNTSKKERSYSQGKDIIKFLEEVREEMCKQSKQVAESKEMYKLREEMCKQSKQVTESKEEMYKLREEMCKQSKQATESKEEICKQLEKVYQDNQEMRKQLTEILTDLRKQRDLHTNGSSGDGSDAPRSQLNPVQLQPPRYRLVFKSVVTDEIEKEQLLDVNVALVDGNNQTVENGPFASAIVELVVVNAEFNQHNNQHNWSREDFQINIIKARQGNSAIVDEGQTAKSIVSNGQFNLEQGAKCHRDFKIFRNSGNKKVRLGVMVVLPTEERVLEGLSNPFKVRGHDRDRTNRRSNLSHNSSNAQRQALVDNGYPEQNSSFIFNSSWPNPTQAGGRTRQALVDNIYQVQNGQMPNLQNPLSPNLTQIGEIRQALVDNSYQVQNGQMPNLQNPLLPNSTQTGEIRLNTTTRLQHPFLGNPTMPSSGLNINGETRLPYLGNHPMLSAEPSTSQEHQASMQYQHFHNLSMVPQAATNNQIGQDLVDDGYEHQNGAMPNTQNPSWENLTQSEETGLNITEGLPQFPIIGNTMFSPGLNITGGQQPRLPFLGNTTMFSTEPSTSQDQEASIQQCQVPHLPILAQATNNQTDELSAAMYGNVRNPNFMRNNYVPVQAIGTQFNTNHIAFPVHLLWDRPNVEPRKHHWDLLEKLMPRYKFNRCGLPMDLMQDFGSLSIIPKEVVQTRCKNAFVEPLEPDDSDDEEWPLNRMLHNRYRLQFVNKACKAYYTWDQIKADDGSLLRIALFDENNTKITSGPLSSASVELVALHGDFNLNGQDYWTSEEFNRSVVCPPPGEEASSVSVLLGGDRILVLADGEACLSDAFFQRTSVCARTGMFKMGVMLASAQDERVQEGISEPFRVMDNVKELNAKDGPTQGFNPAAATLQFPRNTVTETIKQQASRISHVKARSAPCMSILPAAQHTAAMARLCVVEARTTTAQDKQQLLRPTEVPASRTPSPVSHLAPMLVPIILSCSILQRCFLCRRELTEGMHIYMYRGDRAFCSESCRRRHIKEDDSSAIDSSRVTAPDRFHRSGSCYKATPSVCFFLEGRQVQG